MAETTETPYPSSSSSPPPPDLDNIYPVVIRVKRKSIKNNNPIAEFCDWLEDEDDDERPLKRTSIDFEKLSISDPAEKKGLEIGEKGSPLKQSLIDFEKLSISGSNDKEESGSCSSKAKVEEQKLPVRHCIASRMLQPLKHGNDAHSEQKWKRRERKKVPKKDVSINDLCRRCDVLRVDDEEEMSKEADDISSADSELLYKFMPLLRECLPDVADNVQMEIQPYLFSKVLSL
ncbi:hypothetical protein C5167_024893 [Papaver somniferum]|uniref:Uncharacterized protein n=1 Tax=Papaver somniferum TaxID=3469 RepID=A0A4Y7JTK8_PAPSO|nr:RNA-directed DNA methylation 4-like [Papaver somniferum]RZC63128.1 hypothetical protein C5167_024893 [Papaver somniferum]